MGREAQVDCRIGSQAESVKALLESTELVLRGSLVKRRWPLARLDRVQADVPVLRFTADGEQVALALGEPQAQRWAEKIQAPPPSLARKLGISAVQPAWVFGPVEDAELAAALHGARTDQPAQAGSPPPAMREGERLAVRRVVRSSRRHRSPGFARS